MNVGKRALPEGGLRPIEWKYMHGGKDLLYAVRQPVQTQTADFSKLSDEELAQLDRIFCKLSEPQTLPE